MAVATPAERKKRQQQIDSFRKKLTDDLRVPDKQIISAVRGAIRKAWMRWPSKLHYLQSRAIPDENPDTRTKWLYRCEKCNGLFKQGDIEVDHIKGENPCNTLEDIANYAQALLAVTPDDIQLLCIPCHDLKTFMERYGVSEDQARIDMQVIAIEKLKSSGVYAWLKEHGVVEPGKNAKERRQQLVEVLKKEYNE